MSITESAPSFEYKIGIKKESLKYRLSYYNSPYKNSDQELDDISVILDGKPIEGVDVPMHKVVDWEVLETGDWEFIVFAYFIPNGDGTFDQTFRLKSMNPIFKEK